jgi:tRNA-dihydrouridine synthase
LKTGELLAEPGAQERINLALRHLSMTADFKGKRGVVEMRKHLAWYLKGLKDAASIRDRINRMEDADEIRKLLMDYLNGVMA